MNCRICRRRYLVWRIRWRWMWGSRERGIRMMILLWKISMVRGIRIGRKFNLTIKEQSEFRLRRIWRDRINSDWNDRLRVQKINYHKVRRRIVRLWIRVKWNRRAGRNRWGIWVGMSKMRRMLGYCKIECSRCGNRWRRINSY